MSDVTNKIERCVHTFFAGAKDVVATNLATAFRDGIIKLDAVQQQHLLNIVAASLDEGYARGQRSFAVAVSAALKG